MDDFYKSRVYQPERLSISTTDDVTMLDSDLSSPGYFSQCKFILKNPVLNVKSLQLLRATIPNIAQNIPNDEATFWYYKLANVGGQPAPITPSALHMIRLLPSFVPSELAPVGTNYGYNRYFQDYEDLVSELKKACLSDPTEGGPGTYFIPNDVTFDISGTKITFQGLESGYFYFPAGWNDPNLPQAQQFLQDSSVIYWPGLTTIPGQPYTLKRTLNTRLGFTYSGAFTSTNQYLTYVRPCPLVSNQTPILIADSYADLVYSANCTILANIASSAGYDSKGTPNVLCTMPMNAPTLGVAFYNNVINNPLTKIVKDIYEIQLSFFTDSGKPFYFPSSAILNFDLGFTFY